MIIGGSGCGKTAFVREYIQNVVNTTTDDGDDSGLLAVTADRSDQKSKFKLH